MRSRPERELRAIRRDLERERSARQEPPARYRRRRLILAGAGVIVLLAAGLVGSAIAGGKSERRARPPATATRSTATRASSPRAATEAKRKPAARRRPAVSTLELTFQEPSDPDIATGRTAEGMPVRTLHTLVLYPGQPAARRPSPSAGARTAEAGRYPLVVFSQGFDLAPTVYSGLLHAWAKAGYVVAAPTYPDTDSTAPGQLYEADIVNHPADLRFVIASLLAASRDRHSRLYRLIDPRQIALIGHSDGGDVTLAVAANSCCERPHIAAAVILSGAELSSFGGSYFAYGSPPLLVAQGSADTINLPACSVQIYNAAPQPKYYLNIPNAEHEPPYIDPGPMRTGVIRATVAFLNAYLKGRRAALVALDHGGPLPAGETLTSGPTAPKLTNTTVTGTTTLTIPVTNTLCPGA
jgi:dienelactone hydrolase